MILTCPACDTKYVVKDSAIPPEGRKVRCASCKHSWHQDPDPAGVVEENPAPFVSFGGPPEPSPEDVGEPAISEPTPEAVADQYVAEVPEPVVDSAAPQDFTRVEEPAAGEPTAALDDFAATTAEDAQWETAAPEVAPEPAPAAALSPQPALPAVEQWSAGDEDIGYQEVVDDEAPRGRRWLWVLLLLVLIAAAAAAFWFYAPSAWKEKAGIAQAGDTPLQLMITSKDRQELASGNQLLAVSGRVINPTDREQDVPPIQAELRNKDSKQVVHRWTIAPPARVLAPRSSATFNSAEVDIPSGGDELVITLGG
ncbi:zinc-ribbon domain-containing protein [Sphingomonas jaspsi]|uniref:zinc-ribbon domain-containing protein n=1 Tax=Sphingomonas jaspsi TaxID=392409 RepID=UPI0004B05FF0|nr:zinc-ribbon domain-containing protein [Sphingomonas jaspsi]